jgi:Flp pilus assembly pilin Flp
MRFIKGFLPGEAGLAEIEYALILAFVSALLVGAMSLLMSAVAARYEITTSVF